ncbi:MAG TPA: high-potential iron-sulfur protein [Steroidobacteraceae bacterium]|jgi:hypothetical protein|nr:high-potential iron-sulfur protein [Steroidobacteraceae bacterium]
MTSKTFDPSRRRLFRQSAVIASGAALGGLMLKAEVQAQAGTIPKATAQYQDKPHGSQQCGTCQQFIAGKGSSGTCKIVQGDVSAQGWCKFFTPKSS